jgi:phenylacetate-CoA ligase
MIRLLRYWIQRSRHPGRYAQLARLLPIQKLSRQLVLQKQQRDFADMAVFAANHTAFYAARFGVLNADAGRRPVPGDLPILEKQDVISHMDELLLRGIDRGQVKIGHTGGSTGKPLAFYYDDAKHELMLAGMMRGFMMSGWRPGQRVLYLWGASRDVTPGGVFAGGPADFLSTEKTVSAVEFSEERLSEWVDLIRNWQPVLLYGYASALTQLARFIVDTGITLANSLLGVYSTAEVLNDWQRQLMELAFGCKVFNQYGCREVPNIAWECRHGNMHVFTDMVYLESMPMRGEDRLLVTSLTNRLMPFIRYNIGDTGRLLTGDCACGLPFPLMEMDVCRNNDLIRTRAGRLVHPAYFNRLLYGLQQIKQYQWVQTELDRVELNLVAVERLSPQTLAAIGAEIQREVDGQMQLEVNYLNAIPRTESGKHRFVIGLGGEQNRPAPGC